jgi:hypothetical protein
MRTTINAELARTRGIVNLWLAFERWTSKTAREEERGLFACLACSALSVVDTRKERKWPSV